MRLILIRHGESYYNKKGFIQGDINSRLTDLGLTQADKTAKRLKNEKIDMILSSPLKRAKIVAKKIKDFHQNTLFEIKPELKDISYGKLKGRKPNEKLSQIINSKEIIKYGGESFKDFSKRTINFFKGLLKENFGKDILLVTHNPLLKSIIIYLEKVNSDKFYTSGGFKNCSITIFEFNKQKVPKLILYNDISHLK